jgi:hypothetical protein
VSCAIPLIVISFRKEYTLKFLFGKTAPKPYKVNEGHERGSTTFSHKGCRPHAEIFGKPSLTLDPCI